MQNYDTSSGLGANYHELAHGVDCPFHAAYLNTVAYMDRDSPLDHPNSICIWEQDTGSPLHRHYTQVNNCPPFPLRSKSSTVPRGIGDLQCAPVLVVACPPMSVTICCSRGVLNGPPCFFLSIQVPSVVQHTAPELWRRCNAGQALSLGEYQPECQHTVIVSILRSPC